MTDQETRWTPLPEAWEGAPQAVHVVLVDVPRMQDGMEGFLGGLSDSERDRASRFRQMADRDRYAIARGALRALLSYVLRSEGRNVPPAEVGIERSRWGKPYLPRWPALRFNVSHAGDVVLIALAWEREVGVDVEHARTDVPVDDLASAALGDEERAWWRTVPPTQRHRAFFDLWTRKEAIAKAVGTGLGGVEIPWSAASPAVPEPVLTAERVWTVHRVDVAPLYPAAVAAEGVGWPLQTWAYRPSGCG